MDRILGYVGNYFVKLEGDVNALVFSGGIGENNSYLREVVVKRLGCLGFQIDSDKNENTGSDDVCSIESGTKGIVVCKTDEEDEMTRYVLAMS